MLLGCDCFYDTYDDKIDDVDDNDDYNDDVKLIFRKNDYNLFS